MEEKLIEKARELEGLKRRNESAERERDFYKDKAQREHKRAEDLALRCEMLQKAGADTDRMTNAIIIAFMTAAARSEMDVPKAAVTDALKKLSEGKTTLRATTDGERYRLKVETAG